jgi:hypothetical protein
VLPYLASSSNQEDRQFVLKNESLEKSFLFRQTTSPMAALLVGAGGIMATSWRPSTKTYLRASHFEGGSDESGSDSGGDEYAYDEVEREPNLNELAAVGDCSRAIRLLDEGSYTDRSSKGRTPLYIACENKHSAFALLLVQRGASASRPTACLAYGRVIAETPLLTAARNGLSQVAQALVRKGADVNEAGGVLGTTALHWAVRNRLPKLVRFLLRHGAVPDCGKPGDQTRFQELLRQIRAGIPCPRLQWIDVESTAHSPAAWAYVSEVMRAQLTSTHPQNHLHHNSSTATTTNTATDITINMLEEAARPWSPTQTAYDLAPHQFRATVRLLLRVGIRRTSTVFEGDLLTKILVFVGKQGVVGSGIREEGDGGARCCPKMAVASVATGVGRQNARTGRTGKGSMIAGTVTTKANATKARSRSLAGLVVKTRVAIVPPRSDVVPPRSDGQYSWGADRDANPTTGKKKRKV